MPFITEELYQRIPHKKFESICISEFPDANLLSEFEDDDSIKKINYLINAVKTIRSIKMNLDYKNSKPKSKI